MANFDVHEYLKDYNWFKENELRLRQKFGDGWLAVLNRKVIAFRKHHSALMRELKRSNINARQAVVKYLDA